MRVVRGEPGAEELAALVVVWARLTAAAGRAAAGERRPGHGPAGRPFVMTATPVPGADAWRRSGWTA
jgi:hypothetical protein